MGNDQKTGAVASRGAAARYANILLDYWFKERVLFYSSFAIQKQILRGEDTYEFKPVYFIALMDFELHAEEDNRFVFRYGLMGYERTDRRRCKPRSSNYCLIPLK